MSKAPLGSWFEEILLTSSKLLKRIFIFPLQIIIEERQNIRYHTTITLKCCFLNYVITFYITGDSPISISCTWHIVSGFPVPGGLCYHDRVKRKKQKRHPVIFHTGIICLFTMKSFGLAYKTQSASEVNFSYWLRFLDWRIDVHELKWNQSRSEKSSTRRCHSHQKFTCFQSLRAFLPLQAVTDVRIRLLSPSSVMDLGPVRAVGEAACGGGSLV